MGIRKKFYGQLNNCTVLAQLVSIAVLVAFFSVPYWISDSVLELKSPYPFYIGITSVLTPFALHSAWTEYFHYRDYHVIRKFEHPILGLVEQAPARWWSTLSIEGIGKDIFVDNNGGANITDNDTGTVLWMCDNINWIREQIADGLEKCRDIPSRPTKFEFTRLELDNSAPNNIRIHIGIDEPLIAWEYLAHFENGKLIDIDGDIDEDDTFHQE